MESETHKAEIDSTARELAKRISHLPLVDGVADAIALKLMQMTHRIPTEHPDNTLARRAVDAGSMGMAVTGDVGTCSCVACFAKVRVALTLTSGVLLSIASASGKGRPGYSDSEMLVRGILETKEFTAWWKAEVAKIAQREILASAEGGPVH